jgi:hypothetical protein
MWCWLQSGLSGKQDCTQAKASLRDLPVKVQRRRAIAVAPYLKYGLTRQEVCPDPLTHTFAISPKCSIALSGGHGRSHIVFVQESGVSISQLGVSG